MSTKRIMTSPVREHKAVRASLAHGTRRGQHSSSRGYTAGSEGVAQWGGGGKREMMGREKGSYGVSEGEGGEEGTVSDLFCLG